MENALYEASVVPMSIMETVLAAAKELEVLVEKGSKLAVSDVGVGILFAQAAIEGASLNVYINTKSMKDRDRAAALDAKADAIIAEGAALKARIYDACSQPSNKEVLPMAQQMLGKEVVAKMEAQLTPLTEDLRARASIHVWPSCALASVRTIFRTNAAP